jgi:hypothetical protein
VTVQWSQVSRINTLSIGLLQESEDKCES